MEKIRFDEILDLVQYEKIRNEFRKEVVSMKKNRRLPIGDRMTLVFENRKTVLFQIQEMVRVERLVDERAIQHEIDTYNMLIPDKQELSATMLIEIQEAGKIKDVLDELVGLPKNCVFLRVGEQRHYASFDLDQSEEDRISAVQYIKFTLDDASEKFFADVRVPAEIVVDHPHYQHRAALAGAIRESLIDDLRA